MQGWNEICPALGKKPVKNPLARPYSWINRNLKGKPVEKPRCTIKGGVKLNFQARGEVEIFFFFFFLFLDRLFKIQRRERKGWDKGKRTLRGPLRRMDVAYFFPHFLRHSPFLSLCCFFSFSFLSARLRTCVSFRDVPRAFDTRDLESLEKFRPRSSAN